MSFIERHAGIVASGDVLSRGDTGLGYQFAVSLGQWLNAPGEYSIPSRSIRLIASIRYPGINIPPSRANTDSFGTATRHGLLGT